jgi:hypothetical protein
VERQTENGELMLVSGSYFPVLGLQPALRRLLGPADDQTTGAHPVAVLSYRYWETRLGADPAVLNKSVVVNGHPMTIIGVAPRGFEGTTLGIQPQVFVPVSMRRVLSPGSVEFENRQGYWIYALVLPPTAAAIACPFVGRVSAQVRTLQAFKSRCASLRPVFVAPVVAAVSPGSASASAESALTRSSPAVMVALSQSAVGRMPSSLCGQVGSLTRMPEIIPVCTSDEPT